MTFANKGHKHSEQQLQWLSKACWLHSSIHDNPVTTLGLAIKDCELICSTQSEGKEITEQRQHGMGNSSMAIWIFGENLFVRVKYKLSHSILFKRENDMEFFVFISHGPSIHQACWYYLQGLLNTTRQPKIKPVLEEWIFLYYLQI